VNRCSGCGGAVSTRDERCSYCGSPNEKGARASARVESLVAQGVAAVRSGRLPDAVHALSLAISLDEEAVEAYYSLADAWQRLGRQDKALVVMQRLEPLRAGSAALQFNLGVLHAYYGDPPLAATHLATARDRVEKDPDPALLPVQRDEIRSRAVIELERLARGT
jgi:tetratricopeptide (TPR) repeat protein